MSKRRLPLFRVGPISLEFKPEDCWIGAYWKRDSDFVRHRPGIDNPAMPCIGQSFDLWVCVLPMLPIHYTRHWR
jgi:hypothetical protein